MTKITIRLLNIMLLNINCGIYTCLPYTSNINVFSENGSERAVKHFHNA